MSLARPTSILPTVRGPSAFYLLDAEGAPSSSGARFHAALDWFAPGGTIVRCPFPGTVVEVRSSRGDTGQIFGGVVKVRDAWGRVAVCRHIDPGSVREGQRLAEGAALGRVTRWVDGADHIHFELWKTLGGGYRVENMIDPGKLSWGAYGPPVPTPKPKPFPPPYGDSLRLAWDGRSWAGWSECAGPMRWIAAHGKERRPSNAAISWRGTRREGRDTVVNVCKNLVIQFLD